MAKISAQETLFWQFGSLSTAALALITVSNPSPARDISSGWSFSAPPLEDARSTDASHPCNMERLSTTTASKERQCYGIKRNWTNPDKTVMEEEPQSCWSCHKCLLELLCDRTAHNGLNIGTYVAVVILPQLSRSCGEKDIERKNKWKDNNMEMIHSCGSCCLCIWNSCLKLHIYT